MLVALALCVAGCAEPRSNVGAQCSRNSECAAPLVCALQACRAECNSSRDCPIGSGCVRAADGFGVCLLQDESTCGGNADCPSPLVCAFDGCTNRCADDCVAGTVCRDDACFDPSTDTPCGTDVDCAEGVCIGGRCVAECISDRDCRFGGFCVSARCSSTPGPDGGVDATGVDAAVDVPGSVLCPPRTLGAVDVCTGDLFGCAALSDGRAVCWGNNTSDQLGSASTPRLMGVRAAVFVDDVGDAIRVECGGSHACVLRADGSLTCWGGNNDGRLGVGPTGGSSPPMSVLNLTSVTDFDLRQGGGCAIQAEQVWCWGTNTNGELGRVGGGTDAPVTATLLPPATQVAVFQGGGFVLTTDNQIVGFGTRSGEVITDLPFADVVELDANVGRVGASDRLHVCVRREGGEVWCAGNNEVGQLGAPERGMVDDSFGVGVAGLEPSTSISLGSASTCSIDGAGNAMCWGFNQEGNLGIGVRGTNQPTPAMVSDGVSAISISYFFGCGIIGGAVFCWGLNDRAMRGNSDGNEYEPTTPVECLP